MTHKAKRRFQACVLFGLATSQAALSKDTAQLRFDVNPKNTFSNESSFAIAIPSSESVSLKLGLGMVEANTKSAWQEGYFVSLNAAAPMVAGFEFDHTLGLGAQAYKASARKITLPYFDYKIGLHRNLDVGSDSFSLFTKVGVGLSSYRHHELLNEQDAASRVSVYPYLAWGLSM